MSTTPQNPEKEKATVEVMINMSNSLSNQAKMIMLQEVFKTLDKDSMVDFTDFCNARMKDVITHKLEIAGRMAGKKAGELFDATRKNVNSLANQFSQQMGKQREGRDTWSDVSNPYDETEPKK